MNLDVTDSMGPGKLVRHMQNPSYTYDEYLICIGLGPSILSVIYKDPSYSGPSYPSSLVYVKGIIVGTFLVLALMGILDTSPWYGFVPSGYYATVAELNNCCLAGINAITA